MGLFMLGVITGVALTPVILITTVIIVDLCYEFKESSHKDSEGNYIEDKEV